jgi:hypothetical protein
VGLGVQSTTFPPCWSGGESADRVDGFGAETEADSGGVNEHYEGDFPGGIMQD